MGQDISFSRRGWGLMAVRAPMFEKMIYERQLGFRETDKPINYQINNENWDDHKGIRLKDLRREFQKKNKQYV